MTTDTDVARSGGRLWQGLSLQQKQVVWAWAFLAVPILNLLTPLFAAAMMVHLHKMISQEDAARAGQSAELRG